MKKYLWFACCYALQASALPGPPTDAPDPIQVGRGAFYLDDGPAVIPPPNLGQVPDAVPQDEPLHRFANQPYTVLGESYIPDTSGRPYKKRGMASWYGRRFHGKKTASGELYDMFAMTAAHPTLPIPSYARVTNIANGRSVVVRINDRGPFHKSRVMDLSYAAANKLGYAERGSTQIEIEALKRASSNQESSPDAVTPSEPSLVLRRAESPAPVLEPVLPGTADWVMSAYPSDDGLDALVSSLAEPAANPDQPPRTTGLLLQLGAFATANRAADWLLQLKNNLPWLKPLLRVQSTHGVFRVQAGPFASLNQVEEVRQRLRQDFGIKAMRVH